MATSIIAHAPPHFQQGSDAYSSAMYQSFPNYDGFASDGQQNYLYNAEQPQIQYASGDNWASQANTLRRVASRSPSVQHDRTPIRHHKSSVSRSRSTSKSEALLAYATEQAVQAVQTQQHSANTTPSLAQTTPAASPGLYHNQTYSSSTMPSPYTQQGSYYENPSPQFHGLHAPSSNHSQGVSDYLTPSRAELTMQPMLGSSMNTQDTMYLQSHTAARSTQVPGIQPAPMGFAPLPRPLESTPGGIEIPTSRNKPQCWDHGCNGRQFSTFSNLLRHQREKSGTAAKAKCPHCGTEFTRTTARNGHMYGGKCKGMPDATQANSGSTDGHSDEEAPYR